MLTSRGEGTSNTNSPAAFPQRTSEQQFSSSSYSFNQQFHPVIPTWNNPPRPPPAPSSSTTSAPTVSSTVPLPTTQPSASTTSTRNDANFPKLPGPSTISTRSHSSSTAFPTLGGSAGGRQSSSKWATKARKVATAAEVVASRPQDTGGPSPEEQAAEKERSELETLAKLVPVGSVIPRKPVRTLGRGGLRTTGSLAAMQQQRNATSKSKPTPNGANHSTGSLFGLDSSARMQNLSSGPRPHRTRKLSSTALENSNHGFESNGILTPPGAGQSASRLALEEATSPDSSETGKVLRGSSEGHVFAPRSSSGLSLTSSKSSSGRNIEATASISSPKVATKLESVRSVLSRPTRGKFESTSGEFAMRSNSSHVFGNGHTVGKQSLSRAGSVVAPKHSSREIGMNHRSKQDVRMTPESRLSPDSLHESAGLQMDVLEQRRKAFAPSPESKSTRIRNSAYQSARKAHQTTSRRNQGSQPLGANQIAQVSDSSNGRVGRLDFSGNLESSHRLNLSGRTRTSNSQVKVVGVTTELSNLKLNNDDRVVPTNTRAEALRTAINANYKRNLTKANDSRKPSPRNKDIEDIALATARKGVPNLERTVANGNGSTSYYRSQPSRSYENRNGHRTSINSSMDKVSGQEKSTETQGTNAAFMPHDYGYQEGLDSTSSGLLLEHVDPWKPNSNDFGSFLPTPSNSLDGMRVTNGVDASGPSSSVLAGFHQESIAIANGTNIPVSHEMGTGMFTKTPTLGVEGESPEAWMTMTDGHNPEAISRFFLESEARRSSNLGLTTVQSTGNQQPTRRMSRQNEPWSSSSAIEAMIRIQSSSRLERPDSFASATLCDISSPYSLAPGFYNPAFDAPQSTAWTRTRNFESTSSNARNDPCDDVLPPLPEAGTENYDALLKQVGYPVESE